MRPIAIAISLLCGAFHLSTLQATDPNPFLDQAWTLASKGNLDEAQVLFEDNLEIKTSLHGVDDPRVCEALRGLALVENQRGDFLAANQLYQRSLSILEQAHSPVNSQVANAAVGLAECLGNLGDYVGAEILLRRHLEAAIAQNADGQTTGPLMLSLAETLAMLGRHAESTDLFRQAAEVMEDDYGPQHPKMARAWAGLAHTLRRIGRAAEAEALYRRAIEIIIAHYGSPHPETISYRSRLGMCLGELHRPNEALASIEEAIEEADAIYGASSYQAALEQRHLGITLRGFRRHDEAEAVFKSSLAILERTFGPEHPYLGPCLKMLGQLARESGMLDEALAYADRAAATHEPATERDKYELAWILGNKAWIETDAGMWQECIRTALWGAEIALDVQEECFRTSSTRDAILQSRKPAALTRTMVTAVQADSSLPCSTLARVFEMVVRTHGQVVDRLAESQRILAMAPDSFGVDQLRHNLETAVKRVVDVERNAAHPSQIEASVKAHLDREEAERALARMAEQIREARSLPERETEVSAEGLAAALDPGSVLIHYIRYSKVRRSTEERTKRRLHYGAFHLQRTPGGACNLSFVDLGRSSSIDSLIEIYKGNIEGTRPGRRPLVTEEAEYRAVASELYRRIWSPLWQNSNAQSTGDEAIESTRQVFLVLDWKLHLMDFNTLLSPEGELVIERWKTHLLSSASDLLRVGQHDWQGSGLLAVGNPELHLRDSEVDNAPIGGDSLALPCGNASVLGTHLPGAEEEARSLSRSFSTETGEPVLILTGADATETAVKRDLVGKRMAHFATHGFFYEDSSSGWVHYAEKMIDPLLRSGLVLAPAERDDGFLSAQEVVCLDLHGLDWVVLSACGSGLGRVMEKEGPFGLRRAFEMAGARTVVMALWRLDDANTRVLMEEIYRRRLAGESTVDAIREAQLDRMRVQWDRFGRLHPSYWGGIVAEGDWR